MSERKRGAAALILMAAALALTIIPALGRQGISFQSFPASGTEFAMPVPEKSLGTISMNDADAYELCQLKGIGETMAGLIIAEREENGPFYYPEDLVSVKGIGMKKLSQFRDSLDY